MFGALTEFAAMSDWRLIALATACLGVSLLAVGLYFRDASRTHVW
jgi:hypothetical protein